MCGFFKYLADLFDLAFFVFYMLALYGVVFAHNHFFCHGAGILLGHIEMPSARRRVQTDLDRRRLRHFNSPYGRGVVAPRNTEVCLLRMTEAVSTGKRTIRTFCCQYTQNH
jgi:hypothetical protein